MNEYGESNLVSNPRYQGQSGGTDGRGPEGESRYGAMPMSTGTGMAGVGAQQRNLVEPNAHPSQAGYGSSQPGYGQHQDFRPNNPSHNPLRDDFAKDQPGYGQPAFGAPSQGQHTSNLWPSPAVPPNAHRSDLVGQGYGAQREGMVDKAKNAVGVGPNSGAQGYDNYGNPRREGIVDKAKDAVGKGPNSGYDHRRDEPGHGAQGYGQPREGMVDRANDAVGVGPNSGYDNRRDPPSYDNYGNPQREGVVDKMKDAVGKGPNTGRSYDASQEYNPNVNHPSEERGFGGGLGHPHGTNTGYDQSQNLGSGYDNRMATGADAYGQPRREGMVGKVEDGVGVGPNSGYDDRTRTGMDAYVHGHPPLECKTGLRGENDPSMLEGRHGVQGVGHPDGVHRVGEHVPQNILGERRTEPGYDISKDHLSDHPDGHNTTDGTGLGHHEGSDYPRRDVTDTDYDERRGKGFEDTTGAYATKTGTGGDHYDGTNTGTETGYDDTDVHGTGTAPPEEGHHDQDQGEDSPLEEKSFSVI